MCADSDIFMYVCSLLGIFARQSLLYTKQCIYDIQMYIQAINKLGNTSSFFDNLKLVEGPDGELNIELPMTKGTYWKTCW